MQHEFRDILHVTRKGERGERRHLKSTHVPQHHITDPLVVPFDVSIRASLPDETGRFSLYYRVITNLHTFNTPRSSEGAPTREPASGLTP